MAADSRDLHTSRDAAGSHPKPPAGNPEVIDLTLDDDDDEDDGSNNLIQSIREAQRKRKHDAATDGRPRAQAPEPPDRSEFQSQFGGSLKKGIRYTFGTEQSAPTLTAEKVAGRKDERSLQANEKGTSFCPDSVTPKEKHLERFANRHADLSKKQDSLHNHLNNSQKPTDVTASKDPPPPDPLVLRSQASKDSTDPRQFKRARVEESVPVRTGRAASTGLEHSLPKKKRLAFPEFLAKKKRKEERDKKSRAPAAAVSTNSHQPVEESTVVAGPALDTPALPTAPRRPNEAIVPATIQSAIPNPALSNPLSFQHDQSTRIEASEPNKDVHVGSETVQPAGKQPNRSEHFELFTANSLLGRTETNAGSAHDSLFGSEPPASPPKTQATALSTSHHKIRTSEASGSRMGHKKHSHADSYGRSYAPRSNAADDFIINNNLTAGNKSASSQATKSKAPKSKAPKSKAPWGGPPGAHQSANACEDTHTAPSKGKRELPPAGPSQQKHDWSWDLSSGARNAQPEQRTARHDGKDKTSQLTKPTDERPGTRDKPTLKASQPVVLRSDAWFRRPQRPSPVVEGAEDDTPRPNTSGGALTKSIPQAAAKHTKPTNAGRTKHAQSKPFISQDDLLAATEQFKASQARHQQLEKPSTLLVNDLIPTKSSLPRPSHLAENLAVQNVENRQYAKAQSDQEKLKKAMSKRLRSLQSEVKKAHPDTTDEVREQIVDQKYAAYKKKKEREIQSQKYQERRDVLGAGRAVARDHGDAFNRARINLNPIVDAPDIPLLDAFGGEQSIVVYTVYLTKPYTDDEGFEGCMMRDKAFGKLDAANDHARRLLENRIHFWSSRIDAANKNSEIVQSWFGGFDKPLSGQAKLGDGSNMSVMVRQESQLVGGIDPELQQRMRINEKLVAKYAPRYDVLCVKTSPRAWNIGEKKNEAEAAAAERDPAPKPVQENPRRELGEDAAISDHEQNDTRGLEGAELRARLAALTSYQSAGEEETTNQDDNLDEDHDDGVEDGEYYDSDEDDAASSTTGTIANRSPSPRRRHLPDNYNAILKHDYEIVGSFTTLRGANAQAFEYAKTAFRPKTAWLDAQLAYERYLGELKDDLKTRDLDTNCLNLTYESPTFHGPNERRPHDFVQAHVWVKQSELQGPRQTGCDFEIDLVDDFTGIEVAAESARRLAKEKEKAAEKKAIGGADGNAAAAAAAADADADADAAAAVGHGGESEHELHSDAPENDDDSVMSEED